MKNVIVRAYLILAVVLAGPAGAEETRTLNTVEIATLRLHGGREVLYLHAAPADGATGGAVVRGALLDGRELLGWTDRTGSPVRDAGEAGRAARTRGLELVPASGFSWAAPEPRLFSREDAQGDGKAGAALAALLGAEGNRRALRASATGRSARHAVLDKDNRVLAWIGEELDFASETDIASFAKEQGVELVAEPDPLGIRRLLDRATLGPATRYVGEQLRRNLDRTLSAPPLEKLLPKP